MEKVVPWKALLELIAPLYSKTSSKSGRPPYPLATRLRIHLLQQWYDLSDPATEVALIEVPIKPASELLHGEETVVYAAAGYEGINKRTEMEGRGIAPQGPARIAASASARDRP